MEGYKMAKYAILAAAITLLALQMEVTSASHEAVTAALPPCAAYSEVNPEEVWQEAAKWSITEFMGGSPLEESVGDDVLRALNYAATRPVTLQRLFCSLVYGLQGWTGAESVLDEESKESLLKAYEAIVVPRELNKVADTALFSKVDITVTSDLHDSAVAFLDVLAERAMVVANLTNTPTSGDCKMLRGRALLMQYFRVCKWNPEIAAKLLGSYAVSVLPYLRTENVMSRW